MLKRKGYTLVEILVVVVIIGILVALGLPNYGMIKEKSLNREAKATLALIRAAEKIYRMEQGYYYPAPAGPQSDVARINEFLKLSLPVLVAPAVPLWSISVNSTSELSTGTRSGVGADSRVWTIPFSGDTDPTCSGGTGTPSSCL
ncbi:MAG: prepilin-type N-terminal cleavage/methylation domain-containing protein [Candidatus Omnitrophica bacterium]|nr:prepilin-type N-terminal cleavage/methylation domain-containing protein [Candidatus Omnitrophota bacterium]